MAENNENLKEFGLEEAAAEETINKPESDDMDSAADPALAVDKKTLDEDLHLQQNNCENTDGLDRFLQKSRNELMYELRRLQHGDRPVTGQGHREVIDNFIRSSVQSDNAPNTADAQAHRPDAVVVEVQGLFEQHRVSNVLQSAAFRQQLENVIRGSINSATRTRTPAQNQQNDTTTFTVTRPVPRPRNRLVHAVNNFSSRHSNTSETSSNNSDAFVRETVPPEIPHIDASEHRENLTDANSQAVRQPPDWSDISRIQHENIVHEIAELLHDHLVTSTLDGEFRGVLEMQMQERLSTTEANGRQVQQFVNSIQQSEPHIQNDFRHLGYPLPNNDLDDISVTSFSAHAVPYTQSNLYLSREIQTLKSGMDELKNMLRLSMDLQFDTQRAIRQEVSAALNSVKGDAPPVSRPINDTHCLICLDAYSDTLLYQCGHICVCYACGKNLISQGLKCPMCRAPIRDVVKAYRCNDD